MHTHMDKTQENKNQSVSSGESQMQGEGNSTFQFADNRPEAVTQRKLQKIANHSPQAKQTVQLQNATDSNFVQEQQLLPKQENNTGLPDNLKSGIENLSGYSMNDVKVHYNSDKPAQLQAHAYAQGTDIHLGSGQEKHLPHEAWHVVQQKQGRVKPTIQFKGRVNVNDDARLEKEADVMGRKAVNESLTDNNQSKFPSVLHRSKSNLSIQRVLRSGNDPLGDFAAGGSRSILYGVHPVRQTTQVRLGIQDTALGTQQPRHTIDEYNADVGINLAMQRNTAAVGLYQIREALSDPAPVTNWGNYFPGAAAALGRDPDLQGWVNQLAANRLNIGLYDLGDRNGTGLLNTGRNLGRVKLESKDRFKKNMGDPITNHSNNITTKQIHNFLNPQKTLNDAINEFMAMPVACQAALNQWIYMAFFRRTSKLGIDFVVNNLHSTVHFNTSGAVDHTSADHQTNRLRVRGLNQNEQVINQDENRSITISELRHVRKGIANGLIAPGNINWYDEY